MKWILVLITVAMTGCFFDKTETPVVATPKSWVGHWSGPITMASQGRFGDGSWPEGDRDYPQANGYQYALSGAWEFWVAADGKLKGDFIIHGSRIPIVAGQVPAGSNKVDFIIDGAVGYVEFKDDNTVTGVVYEPHPESNKTPQYKRGIISGAKQPN
jgi:hypothetical protein